MSNYQQLYFYRCNLLKEFRMFINYSHPKENASNNWFELRNGSLGYPTNRTKSERFINQICKFSNWRGHSEWVEGYCNSINQQKFRTICIHHHYAPSLLLINKIIIKSWIWFRVPLRQMPHRHDFRKNG